MIEIFKDIQGFEGLYQVSNMGNVKSLNYRHTGKERILKPIKCKNEYLRIELWKQGKQKFYYIHRLVAMAFIENPNNLPEINHRDEDKTNNAITNLEWCTRLYNNNYGTINQRIAEKLSKPVICVETGKIYPSTIEVERQLGFANQYISAVCTGKRKQAYGFHWRYVN